MTKISEIIKAIETFAPPQLQESYDNCGLLVGNKNNDATGALLTLDVTPKVIDEAIQENCNLIIAHHPIIFGKLTSITADNPIGSMLLKAIQHNIAIYAAHTNIDNVKNGVSFKMAEKLALKNVSVLSPMRGKLLKLVTFCPNEHIEKVRQAVFDAGAGWIGNYSECGYYLDGTGSFKGEDDANPYVGKKGERHYEKEIRFETIYPAERETKILKALFDAHPYEEVAYDLYPLNNVNHETGSGAIGTLEQPIVVDKLLEKVKKIFNTGCIRYTKNKKQTVQKIALCGGSGAFLFNTAKKAGADVYISGDFKYHDFFEADEYTIIMDIGHYESEQFTPEIFNEIISQRFRNFAVRISKISTNPINYF